MADVPGIVMTYPFPLGAYNGGARLTREIALEIGRRGIPVYLMSVSAELGSRFPRRAVDEERAGKAFDQRLAEDGVHIIRVRPHPLHQLLDGLHVRRALAELLAEKPVSAVISYYHDGLFLPNFLQSRAIPFAILAIWQSYEAALKLPAKVKKPFRFLSSYTRRRMIIAMYRRAEAVFSISDHTGRELVRLMGLDSRLIKTSYLGVAPEFAAIHRPKPGQIRRFLFFGRVIQSKGVADAIEALARLKALGRDDWEYHISGEGQLAWARALIAEAGLEEQVFLQPAVGDAGLRQLLSGGHLVLMPSHNESFGLSFAEAQAAGLPVIGYAAGSVPEVVTHGQSGWLAPTGRVDRLVEHLVQAVENPEQTYRMGLAGRERVTNLFTWQRTVDTILAGLDQIGAGQRL